MKAGIAPYPRPHGEQTNAKLLTFTPKNTKTNDRNNKHFSLALELLGFSMPAQTASPKAGFATEQKKHRSTHFALESNALRSLKA